MVVSMDEKCILDKRRLLIKELSIACAQILRLFV